MRRVDAKLYNKYPRHPLFLPLHYYHKQLTTIASTIFGGLLSFIFPLFYFHLACQADHVDRASN
jgi:hypothetical protein